jgi:oxygen-independent coproporphyrinogen-3 oxidase
MSASPKPLAVYIHWPFCRSKCPYCDFNSHVAVSINHDVWRQAYRRELEYYAALLPNRRITSVFFGGGTPSLMEPATVTQILNDIARLWSMDANVEITLEANPTSVEADKFAGFRTAGVNRLSLGVQALNIADLKFLGREHNVDEARTAIELARKYFPRYSFDLIYARHGQSLSAWEAELREALTMANGHMSLYQLTIEPNTQFYTLSQRGEPLTAPEDTAAEMFALTQHIMADAGMPAYEISNHARTGQESRHNLTYWQYDDYIGIGPGAHGRVIMNEKRRATEDHRAPDVWLRHIDEAGHGTRVSDIVDTETAMREALMMGLRLNKGISAIKWQTKFGTDLISQFIPQTKIQRLRDEKYVGDDNSNLMLTDAGRQRLNAVLRYLLT